MSDDEKPDNLEYITPQVRAQAEAARRSLRQDEETLKFLRQLRDRDFLERISRLEGELESVHDLVSELWDMILDMKDPDHHENMDIKVEKWHRLNYDKVRLHSREKRWPTGRTKTGPSSGYIRAGLSKDLYIHREKEPKGDDE